MVFAEASSDSSVNLALVAIVGSVITALFKLLNDNTKALKKVATSSDKVAQATTKAAKEAKQRNGHLGEQSIKIVELITHRNNDISKIKESNKKIADTLGKSALIAEEDREALLTQVVKEQKVEHQTVKTKE